MKKIILLVALPFFIIGCDALTGEEIARLPINTVSTEDNLVVKETNIELKNGDEIAIWSDIDMEYDGDVALLFRVEMLKEGEKYGGFEIDPTDKNITIGEVKTSLMSKTDWRFSGKNKELKIEEDAQYTFKAILVASENSSLVVNKAELVFKK